MQNVCPQCNSVIEGPSSRLVQDSCGHQKCRICLLRDEDECLLCTREKGLKSEKPESHQDNRAAVITFKGKNCSKQEHTVTVSNPIVIPPKHTTVAPAAVLNQKRNYHVLPVPGHIFLSKDNPTVYTCSICKKSFKTRSHVKYHLYCAGGTKPLRCDKCDKEFISKSHLEIHRRGHVGSRPYACEKCGKTFMQSGKLKRHSLLHSEVRSFVCQECGKSFRTKDSLRTHLLVHSREKPYSCKLCKAKFNNSSNLKKHLLIHSKDKVHMCDQCGKRFKLKSSLSIHHRAHSRLRPYKCVECTKSFVTSKDLQRHRLIHLDVKAYTCGICATSFRRKDNLNRHLRNTHPGKKGTFTKKSVKQNPAVEAQRSTVVDNPNAINVITAPPTRSIVKEETAKKAESKAVPVINAPLKLAFKTSEFKNSYNIHSRDYVEPLDSDVNIYEKILLPNNPSRSVETRPTQPANADVSQTVLPPLNYGTSFEHKKHAVIKNIKFKLPPKYINLTSKDDVVPLQPVKDIDIIDLKRDETRTYVELKPLPSEPQSVTPTVIVNCQQNETHWRKRTSQNFQSVHDL